MDNTRLMCGAVLCVLWCNIKVVVNVVNLHHKFYNWLKATVKVFLKIFGVKMIDCYFITNKMHVFLNKSPLFMVGFFMLYFIQSLY